MAAAAAAAAPGMAQAAGQAAGGIFGAIGQLGAAGINYKTQTDTAAIFNTGASERQKVADQAFSSSIDKQFNYGKDIQQIQNNFDLDSTVKLLGMRSNDYQSAGLPSYLGWQGKDLSEQIPKVIQFGHGANGYASKLVGDPMSANFTGNRMQQHYGWGNVIASYQKSH